MANCNIEWAIHQTQGFEFIEYWSKYLIRKYKQQEASYSYIFQTIVLEPSH